MFRPKQLSSNNNKTQVRHRDKPRALAKARRPKKEKISKTIAVPVEPIFAQEIHTNNELATTSFNYKHDHKWQALLLLLILGPYFVRACAPLQVNHNQRLKDGKLDDISNKVSKCRINNNSGVGRDSSNDRVICNMNGFTYFIKNVPVAQTNLSLEIYNQEIAKSIGIRTANPQLFTWGNKVVVATEEIKNINFSRVSSDHLAKVLVAMSFITDLNRANWGEDEHGNLVLIDIDGANMIKENINSYLFAAHHNIKNFAPSALSINILNEVIRIYEKLSVTPLPPFSEDFHVTPSLYSGLIKILIQVCKESIRASVKAHHVKPDELNNNVSEIFLKRLESKIQYKKM